MSILIKFWFLSVTPNPTITLSAKITGQLRAETLSVSRLIHENDFGVVITSATSKWVISLDSVPAADCNGVIKFPKCSFLSKLSTSSKLLKVTCR